jgi:hypothetical protein
MPAGVFLSQLLRMTALQIRVQLRRLRQALPVPHIIAANPEDHILRDIRRMIGNPLKISRDE